MQIRLSITYDNYSYLQGSPNLTILFLLIEICFKYKHRNKTGNSGIMSFGTEVLICLQWIERLEPQSRAIKKNIYMFLLLRIHFENEVIKTISSCIVPIISVFIVIMMNDKGWGNL